ncbi:UNVERIFIED_CONTAM: heat shock protein [Sesamum radiatum]|uniref:Heat shock protein n=1 Tax=Sesamum radiatum TaxID=300843 RepID=A0AAW2R4A4_SESRA
MEIQKKPIGTSYVDLSQLPIYMNSIKAYLYRTPPLGNISSSAVASRLSTMAGKGEHALAHEEFEPLCKWQRSEDLDVLEIHLQEFKKEQLKVQISNHGVLKISGERPLDASRKSKFYKEIQISSNCDASAIRAKFVNGCLYITMPKRKPALPPKNGNGSAESAKTDQTPTPEPAKNQSQAPQPSGGGAKAQTQAPAESSAAACEFQGRAGNAQCLRLAKVAVALAAMAAAVSYFVYRYKSRVAEDDDWII